MSAFDDIIKAGIAAAESAWGSNFTLAGMSQTFTGTFDRHSDSSAPTDGGYFDQISATIVCARLQFDILLGIATEDDAVFPRIGQRLTHDNRKYLITGREIDAASITLTLRSVNR